MADFDGDGRLDLLSGSNCCLSTTFHVYLRRKDGTFGERQDFRVLRPAADRLMTARSRVLMTDWDGDGKAGLVFTTIKSDKLFICDPRPDETGGLMVKSTWTLPGDQVMWGDLAVADWDGDGKPDLLLCHLRRRATGRSFTGGCGCGTRRWAEARRAAGAPPSKAE